MGFKLVNNRGSSAWNGYKSYSTRAKAKRALEGWKRWGKSHNAGSLKGVKIVKTKSGRRRRSRSSSGLGGIFNFGW